MAMSSIKEWARTIYLVSVFSALALLIVPRSMLKQVRFVVEMLLIFVSCAFDQCGFGGGPETVLMNVLRPAWIIEYGFLLHNGNRAED